MNKKFLSFLLALCMILGMVPFTFAASAEDGETASDPVYYVSNMYGLDTNDGSEQNPFKTISKAVNMIGTSSNGTVMIVDGKTTDGEGNTAREYTMYPMYSDDGMYGKHYGTNSVLYYDAPTHTGTITYKGIDSKNGTAAICFASDGNNMGLNGPSKFENVTLIEGLNTSKSFFTRGYPVEFSNVNYTGTSKYLSNSEQATTPNSGLTDGGSLSFSIFGDASSAQNRETDYHFGANSVKLGSISFTNWNTTAVSITKDLKVTVDSGANVGKVNLFGSNANFVGKNINLVLNQAVTKLNNGTAGTFNAIQVVMNNGVNVAYTAPTLSTITAGTWVLRGATGVTMDTTDDAGKFAVSDSAHVYAYGMQSGNKVAYHSVDGVLTVPAGEWKVTTNVETAKAYFVDVATWTENSDGTISYTYADGYAPGTYYVMKDGNGNGLSADKPMGSVAQAVAAIEADNGVSEGKVVILNNPKYHTYDANNPESDYNSWFPHFKYDSEGKKIQYDSEADTAWKYVDADNYELNGTTNYTAWTRPAAHTKHVTITANGDKDVFLALGQNAGTGDFNPNGPTTFDNINLLRLRTNDEGIMSGGHDLTITETVGIYEVTIQTSIQMLIYTGNGKSAYELADGKDGNGNKKYTKVEVAEGETPNGNYKLDWGWYFAVGESVRKVVWGDSQDNNFIKFGQGRLDKDGNGGKMTVKQNADLVIKGNYNSKTETYENDMELNVDTNGHKLTLNLANSADSTYQKNLNLVIGNVSSLTVTAVKDVTVNAALQVIHPDNVTFERPDNVFVDLVRGYGVYDITAPAGLLSTTAKAGTYKVNGDATVYAYNTNAMKQHKVYVSVDGTLTLPYMGKYVVKTSLDDVKAVLGNVDFYDDGNGTLTVVKIVKGTYYVMYGGDDEADGTTPNAPLASTAKAIELIESDSTLTEGTIVVMNNPVYKTSGYWQHSSDTKADNKDIYYLAWTPKSHKKPITVRGFDADSTTGLAIAQRAYHVTGDLTIMGPTTFDNIFILRHRGHDEGLATCGYDVTFTDSVLFKQFYGGNTYDMYYGIPKNAVLVDAQEKGFGNFIKLGSGRAASGGKGGMLKVDTKKAFSFDTDWKEYTYENNVGFDIDTNGKPLTITWANGTGADIVYKKNLNIVLRNVGAITNYMGTTINYKKNGDKVVY